ncbi:MAG TPA: hypothetical protein VGO16_00225 [Pseudonocardiaceae bacterium]|nr:hypothetical protein [Pseudonocardiaceae bacterium]
MAGDPGRMAGLGFSEHQERPLVELPRPHLRDRRVVVGVGVQQRQDLVPFVVGDRGG